MKSTVTLMTGFSASHTPVWFDCSDRGHGHRWDVEVEIEFDPQEPFIENPADLVLDLGIELDERDLNDMLAPHRPDSYGVAAFFLERVNAKFKVQEVRVCQDLVMVKLLADDVRRR